MFSYVLKHFQLNIYFQWNVYFLKNNYKNIVFIKNDFIEKNKKKLQKYKYNKKYWIFK